jgi:hypothetical protein
LTKLKAEHQAAKDELARLKNLPPRPPQKPSGMDKATERGGADGGKSPKGEKSSRRRGSQLDKLTIGATVVVRAKAPAGARHKGYEEIVVQDLNLSPQVTRYRRERWETPEGETIIAPLDPGIVGGYGPNLHRLVLALHFSGQVTCERIVALVNGMGVLISKRQVVRLLTAKLETFRAEDEAVLKAGLGGAFVTGRRHRRAPCRQERLHHADRLRYLHGVSYRPEQVTAGVSVAAVRRHGALCDQRGGARLYERPPTAAGRHRQVCGS